jgi:signal transduction histidine kinase
MLLASVLALPTTEAIPPLLVGVPILTYGWLGARIAERAPRNPVGWLLSSAASAAALGLLGVSYSLFGERHATPALPLAGAIGVINSAVSPIVVGVSLMLTFLLFPTGRPPSPRWRPVAWLTVTAGAASSAAIALNELKLIKEASTANTFDTVFISLVGVASFLTVASLFARSRRGTPEERAPIRGLLLTLIGMAISFAVFIWRASVETWDPLIFVAGIVLAAGTLILIPLALTVSMLRYGLFEYEVGVRKRIAARVLSGLIFLAIAAAVFMLSTALGGVVLAGRDAQREVPTMAALAVGTVSGIILVIAARWARRFADRVVFRDRATPYEVLSAFSDRLGESFSLDDVVPQMARLLAEGTGATAAAVWLETGGSLRAIASAPEDAQPPPVDLVGGEPRAEDPHTHAFAVRHHGELLGALAVTMHTNDPMNAAKEQLVRGLANQAGLVLRNVALLEDVRESRRRIVAAQDDRARRLERNIHDGAQQQLVALAVKLRLADSLVDRDTAKAHGVLAELQVEATDALETLRDLARGIYPPLLADEGLVAALEAQARKSPLPVGVEADAIGRFSPEVEATVYFCALEALNNSTKYAGASRVTVRLAMEDHRLRFDVEDDGAGFDPTTTARGSGLQNMEDRLTALGGSIEIRSQPERGTKVSGSVPIGGKP